MARQTGIRIRHGRRCRSLGGGACNCAKNYEASVFSVRDGKKIRQSFPTEAAARQWRADTQSAVSRGAMRAPTPTTLREAAAALIVGARDGSIRNRKGQVYKPSVIRGFETVLNVKRDKDGRAIVIRKPGEADRLGRSLLDDLGGRKLSEIERSDLQDLVDRMLGWKLDPSTIRNTLNALRPIFRRAVSRGELLVNPTTGLEIPAPRGKRMRIADPAEAERLIGAVAKADQALWAVVFYAGLRLGELMALRWDCVDLAKGVIRVEQSYDPKEKTFIDVKSTAGNRNVPIAAVLRDYLLDHKITADREEGLVFGRTPELPLLGNNTHSRAVTRWANAKLTPIGFHEARHTFPSLMIAAGVNVKAISTYMGHASVKITLHTYGHLMPNSEEEAAARLDEYLARASCAPVNSTAKRISADHSGERDTPRKAAIGSTMRVSAQPR